MPQTPPPGVSPTATTRRNLLRAGATTLAAATVSRPATVPAAPLDGRTSRWDHEYTFGRTQLFMEEYHQGSLEILGRLHGELEWIGELTSRAASVIRQGHTVWTSMNTGHMPHEEQKATRRGSPRIMKDHRPDQFAALQKGDMIFTNHCNRDVLAARERGVYVVCVTVNYVDNEFRPEGFTDPSHSNPDKLKLKDVSNAILHSHVPYEQGLVHAPEIPQFALCPSSQTGLGAVHWMLNAELANKLADPAARSVDRSSIYLQTLTQRVRQLRAQMPLLREVAVTMTRRIRAGGRWFAKSIEHAGFESEFNVASGVRVVNTGDWQAQPAQNVMLITAISPAYRPEAALALEKQIEGAYVVGIGPDSLDGVRPPGCLLDIADAGFDNLSPESGGVIEIPMRQETICPTSGVVGNILQQMLVAQWADEMLRRGAYPYFLMGYFQRGGREYNNIMAPFFQQQGY